MLIYSVIIGTIVLIITLISVFFGMDYYGYDLGYNFGFIAINILVVFLIDLFMAFIVNQLPKKWFNYKFKRFKIFKWERSFYEKIGIKKWKDNIPELGWLANFRKNKVARPNDNEYIEKFLEECCYGEIVHMTSIFLGFLIVFLNPKLFLIFALPIGIGNAIIHFLSLAILRYTRPKLLVLYKRNLRMKERENKEIVN